MVLDSTVPQISGLADSVHSKCGNLAANETLEPTHAVICKLLRTGADFSRAVSLNPIHVAAIAITPFPQLDIDGVLQKKSRPNLASRLHQGLSAGLLPLLFAYTITCLRITIPLSM